MPRTDCMDCRLHRPLSPRRDYMLRMPKRRTGYSRHMGCTGYMRMPRTDCMDCRLHRPLSPRRDYMLRMPKRRTGYSRHMGCTGYMRMPRTDCMDCRPTRSRDAEHSIPSRLHQHLPRRDCKDYRLRKRRWRRMGYTGCRLHRPLSPRRDYMLRMPKRRTDFPPRSSPRRGLSQSRRRSATRRRQRQAPTALSRLSSAIWI